ncbi:asparaginase [Kitasatospora aureofaciens]|uniref:Asparaginase n=1 Tax=Kitasatospora aureofaciens TaxID=1894 RepID=A0A1E7N747_KITAU|nr:asparaginase [Kitasatospora aureofaciens]QEV00379.1 asparaginase [Streptomyces viridifaciens]ARF79176.1 asparaginase [Kitasatospora aureofaciens]OEV36521.1 asparaginase [Kitasatospora aureofaciens]UKZ06605.1 asparaginase [Streptomyces viridifaciens]GGU82124.1 asparaginase [Kitasatospora aureofaciens]
MSQPATPPVLAEVIRSGFTEGRHHGSLVLLAADGSVEFVLGDPDAPVFPRSTAKPFQAVATLRAGLAIEGELLALAASSHSAESFHLDGVRAILGSAGLDESALRTPADLPLDETEAELLLAAGGRRAPILMDCSGKHAGWLAACVANGWDTGSYLDPAHPIQELAREALAEGTGETPVHTGVDGCGAPLLAVTLTGLARGYRSLVLAAEGTAQRRIADAMRAHPEYVAGTRRADTWLMRAVPGALSKMGAEAVQVVALPDGRALAFKIDDGAERARGPVLAAALRRLGVTGADDTVERIGAAPLLGGGAPVGEVRAAF